MEILAILPVAGRVAAGTAAAGNVAEGGRAVGNLPAVGGMGCTPADLGPLGTGVAPGPVCSWLWKKIIQTLSFEDGGNCC